MQQHHPDLLEKPSSLRRWPSLATNLPVCLAMVLVVAAAYFGASRDFGAFLISVPVLLILFIAAFIGAVWVTVFKIGRAHNQIAWLLISLAPLIYLYSYKPVQQISFLFWAPSHYSQLAEASKRNGIVRGWDSWGMAGQDTFSYLVADTEDRLGSKDRADKWTKQIGQSCGLWDTQRVWPRLYIVTTYTNCPYDGIEPAN